jgi:hypothetical protein
MGTAVREIRGSDIVPFVDHRVWVTMGSEDAYALATEITACMARRENRSRARTVASPVSYTWDEIADARPQYDLAAERIRAADAAIRELDETVRAGMVTPEEAHRWLVRNGVLTDDEPVIP